VGQTAAGEPLRLRSDAEPPGLYDPTGYVATTYAEIHNIAALEAVCAAGEFAGEPQLSVWRAVLQAVELALDVTARLAATVPGHLDAGDLAAAADRLDWIAGLHATLVSLGRAGHAAHRGVRPGKTASLSVMDSPARQRVEDSHIEVDRALRRALSAAEEIVGDRLGGVLEREGLSAAPARLDRAWCLILERWRVWQNALTGLPIATEAASPSWASLVAPERVARVLDYPRYSDHTLMTPFRGLHLVPERLAREVIRCMDDASRTLASPSGPERWVRATEPIVAASALMRPIEASTFAMTEGLSVAAYRLFRKSFGQISSSESEALAGGLFHRAPERLAQALVDATAWAEGEPLAAAVARLPAEERGVAALVHAAFAELHAQHAAWLDTHMLLPVLHLGVARSLAGRTDAVTSNRTKRVETLSRGALARFAAVGTVQREPTEGLDRDHGYARWRALRLGEVQLGDVAHLDATHPAGDALRSLMRELRSIERAARATEGPSTG
jgi:hypothetical protein